MHYSEINHEAEVSNTGFELEQDHLGDRPVLLEGFAMVDSTDVLVPCDPDYGESMILALTEDQAMRALIELAEQVGKKRALAAVNGMEG